MYRIGRRVIVALEGTAWSATLTPDLPGNHEQEDVARGWRAATEIAIDVGPLTVRGSLALAHVGSAFSTGTYRTAGLSIGRSFQLSRWMRAWISLGVSQQMWSGAPPAGEANGTTFLLSLGTTFE